MKRKEIEKVPVKKPKWNRSNTKGWITTAQMADGILILDIFKSKAYQGRHCFNPETGEYDTYVEKVPKTVLRAETGAYWTASKLGYLYTEGRTHDYTSYYGTFTWDKKYNDITKLASKADYDVIKSIKKLKGVNYRSGQLKTDTEMQYWREAVTSLEDSYTSNKSNTAEERRVGRVQDLMDMAHELPPDFSDWAYDKMFKGVPGDAVYDSSDDGWYCSECHITSPRKDFKALDGGKARVNKLCICPECREKLIFHRKPRSGLYHFSTVLSYTQRFCLFDSLNDECSVVRYFTADGRVDPIYKNDGTKGKVFGLREQVRVVLYKKDASGKPLMKLRGRQTERDFRIFYSDYHGSFDYKSNPMHYSMGECYAYPNINAVEQTLKSTAYEPWTRFFMASVAAGTALDYNRCMACKEEKLPGVLEMLYKGRFRKLCSEGISEISLWDGKLCRYYYNSNFSNVINLYGKTASDVLMLRDGQMINRLRDMDGASEILIWLRWSEQEKKKISQEALIWLKTWNITRADVNFILDRMTPDKIMHYVKRQQETSYRNLSYKQIINNWADYIRMAGDLKKKVNDEMIYRPADLKLRHDEYVEECNRKAAQIRARKDKEYAKEQKAKLDAKFPEAKKILKDIKEKLEWSNDDYIIVVPGHLTDIVFEGQQLHHCAGATDRYFDRICQRETYIVFLRKAAAPKEPYYTIEVEPGGVIRQHRGMYDEEPEIELVKPALKEWQKEIRKRMKEEDRKAAEISKKKRAENIKELEEKKNLRVLKALMDDFMDIEDIEAEEERSKAEETEHKKAGRGKDKDSEKTVKTKKIRKIA